VREFIKGKADLAENDNTYNSSARQHKKSKDYGLK
jgi:hypothetical protein